jgi:hypothetical protein
MNKLVETLKIADIHVKRIHSALNHINDVFPMTKEKLESLPEERMVWIDFLINRFGKLQDIIGSKIIDLFLDSQGEIIENLTTLDKIHKMAKLGIISDEKVWKDMRNARNHIAHEYSDHPELMAIYMNQIVSLIPSLLEMFDKLKKTP